MATEPSIAVFDATLVRRRQPALSSVLSDYWALTKPEINFMIAITTAIAFCLGSPKTLGHFPLLLLHTVLGTVLVASGAGALNQLIERQFDAQMRRTAQRPIPAGRIKPFPALVFGMLLSLAGGVYIAFAVGPSASAFALLTFCGYLFLYTPLKRRTPLCTLVGAFPGAMPVLIGYIAAAGKLDARGWLLFAILFLWQFPHFMAIAWMYRDDYARAGFAVLPPGRDRVRFMAWQSLLPTLALMPLTFTPLVLVHSSSALVVASLLLSFGFVYFAARLAVTRSSGSARRLLLFSIAYLPMGFVIQVLARV
jgi:heme o synthase